MSGYTSVSKVDLKKLGPPTSTVELANSHNQRVEALETLWARISLRAKGTYDNGDSYEEQGEGHLQIVKPDKLSINIGKLGETYFVFGANSELYWSFDLSNGDHKTALIGRLDLATPEKIEALGLPVHPAELIGLTGLMPIDLASAGGTRWAEDGKSIGLTMPSRWGSLTLWFDPRTELVVRSQAFNLDGELIATASLSRYKKAAVPEHMPIMVPGKIEITSPGDSGWVRIELSGPRSKAINARVYQPAKLIRAYRIDESIDLDAVFDQEPTATDTDGEP